jgi:hypothetical protein
MSGLATCEGCGEHVELSFAAQDLRSPDATSGIDAAAQARGPGEELMFGADGYEFVARLPTSEDMGTIAEAGSIEEARRMLLGRCVLLARHCGQAVEVERLPEPLAAAVAQRLGEADPLADVRLAVKCPQCGRAWNESFDVASFLWAEIHAWAVRLLREVHCLAAAYGWRESDILAMSPWRRQAYLEMIAAG